MGMTKKSIAAFYKLPNRVSRPALDHVMVGPLGVLYASDGCLSARTSAFQISEECAQPSDANMIQFIKESQFDPFKKYGGIIAASTPKAEYHGEGRPIISEDLRAYVRFTQKLGQKIAYYPLGDTFVDAALLADALDIVPDALVFAFPRDPLKPLFFHGTYAEAALFPVRFSASAVGNMLKSLAAYQEETQQRGASLSNPFMTISFSEITEQAAEEARRQQEAKRQLEQEHEENMRQCQAEEVAEREQLEKEKAEKRESTRKVLLSDGENMPVDGASICELAAEMGVSIPLRTKGFILQKLSTISIADGQFRRYTFRSKKGAQGSDACFKYIQALINALKMQSLESQEQEKGNKI